MHVLFFLLSLFFFSVVVSDNLLVPLDTNSKVTIGKGKDDTEDPTPLLLGLDEWNSLRSISAEFPALIKYDLQNDKSLSFVHLIVIQDPPGPTVHYVTGGKKNYDEVVLCKIDSNMTVTGDRFSCKINASLPLRYIQISTTRAPGWVGWKNITITGRDTFDSPEYQIAPVKLKNYDFPDIYYGNQNNKNGQTLSLIFGSDTWNSRQNSISITYDFKNTVVIERLGLFLKSDYNNNGYGSNVTCYIGDSLRQNKIEIAFFKDMLQMRKDLSISSGSMLARYLTIEANSMEIVKWNAIEIYGFSWEDIMPLKK